MTLNNTPRLTLKPKEATAGVELSPNKTKEMRVVIAANNTAMYLPYKGSFAVCIYAV